MNLIKLRPDLNENTPKYIQEYIEKYNLNDLLVMASSGTSNQAEDIIYFIPQKSMRGHALEICKNFNITKKSKILCVLPDFYMGSLSAFFRAQVSGSQFIQKKWNLKNLATDLKENQITHLSLVPTQVFDLCKSEQKPNPKLEYCFVGGARLSRELKLKFIDLGWPLFETYGLTELCSQVATSRSTRDEVGFKILPFIDYKIDKQDRLKIKSDFHFSHKMIVGSKDVKFLEYKEFCDNKGYFKTSDIAQENEPTLISIKGRVDSFVKINSKFVNLLELERKISLMNIGLTEYSYYLKAIEDERSGYILELVSLVEVNLEEINKVLGFNISKVKIVEKISKTDSGKLRRL